MSEEKPSRVNLADCRAFRTKDGSQIREILAYRNSRLERQSLAEAAIDVGGSTAKHYHPKTEEVYYITAGCGRMILGDEEFDVGIGDAVAIPPGVPHKIFNTGELTLRILCCCVPAYEDDDTVMLEEADASTAPHTNID